MPYTIPPWNLADEWTKLLEQLRISAGASAVSLYISNDLGDVSYAVGANDEAGTDDA